VGEWGRIWRYEGKRATTWRIRYRDATGRRVLETLGPEPHWNRKRAQQELNRRLAAVQDERYQAPSRIVFADYAVGWQEEILPARGLNRPRWRGTRAPSPPTSSPSSGTFS